MGMKNFEPRTFMMSEEARAIINGVSIDKKIGNARALDLIIEEWFDYQEKKHLENKSNNLDFKESKERLIYLEKMVDKILDKLENDRK